MSYMQSITSGGKVLRSLYDVNQLRIGLDPSLALG